MKTKLTARLTYANVMATTAVFIALGGTSYAALTITGKNVKNGSLSGADIRNSSITGSDVANGSLVTRDFKPGVLPAGPQGPPGPPGPKGAPAPAATVAGYSGRATSVPVGGYDMVISKDLPAGKYMLSASAEIRGAGSPSGYMGGISVVQCSIPGYETHDFYLSPNGTYVSEMESVSLTSAIDHPGGAVAFRCERVWNDAVVKDAALNAIRVGSLG